MSVADEPRVELACPFKGLASFDDSELDALLFFGRERDVRVIESNLLASRLTVLYGASGVGKSSVVRAGVVRRLRALPERPLVVVGDAWGGDPAADLAAAVAAAAGVEGGSLPDVVERAQAARPVYLVLDQAEEHFVYHAEDDRLERELAEVVLRPLRANVLVIVRDDALARLDVFRALLPGVFANVLRLSPLDRAAARRAIVEPLRRFAELTGRHVEIEPALVDRVLDEVAVGEIGRGLGGSGSVEATAATAPEGIEAPYLQLVLERLWDEERAAGSDLLRRSTLERLGGARKIVGDHLERALAELAPGEQAIAALMFSHLVTPSGTKIAHRLGDLAAFAGVSEAELRPVLEGLLARRILRSEERGAYAIYHDVLAAEVLAWCRRFGAERALAAERRASARRHRRLAALAGAAVVAAAIAAGLAVWALTERSNASEQSSTASARALDASAAALLDSDPELSLLLASEAARRSPGPTTEEVLRSALQASAVRAVFALGEPVAEIAWSPDGSRVAAVGVEGAARLWDVATGRTLVSEDVGPRAGVSFTTGGALVLHGEAGPPLVFGGDGDPCPAGTIAVADAAVARNEIVLSDGRLTDAASCAMLGRIRGLGRPAARVVGSGDGTIVAFVQGASVTFVRLPGRTVVSRIRAARSIAALELDRRGDTALAVLAGSPAAQVWDVAAGRLQSELSGHQDDVVAAAIDAPGRIAATGSVDGQARVWDVRAGTVVTVLSGHLNFVGAIDLTADGEHVVTASPDRTARVWTTTGMLVSVLAGHEDDVTAVAFVGDGTQVLTGSADGTVRLWESGTRPDLRPWSGATPAAPALEARSPDGRAIARAAGETVTIVRRDGARVALVGHRRPVTSVAFSPDGRRLVTASKDNDAIVWDTASGRPLRVLRAHFGPVFDARYSPDGRWIVTAGPTTAGLWNAANGAFVRYLRGAPGPLAAAAFAPDSRAVVTVSRDGTVRRYRCDICGTSVDLRALALARLAATGRGLSAEERALYLG
jgi:WD40 repeat protein